MPKRAHLAGLHERFKDVLVIDRGLLHALQLSRGVTLVNRMEASEHFDLILLFFCGVGDHPSTYGQDSVYAQVSLVPTLVLDTGNPLAS